MERRLLQILILVGGLVPVFGGGAGVVLGARAFGGWPGPAADSHVRYLSGLLLAIGLAYWACVPTIERRGDTVRLLTLIVLVGGLARLAGVLTAGDPGPTMRLAMFMELAVAPTIGFWQARVALISAARRAAGPSRWGSGRVEAGLDALPRSR